MNILTILEGIWVDYKDSIMLLSAAVTLIGVVFSLIKSGSLSKESVDRTAQAENTLKADHTLLLERSADIKASVYSMCSAIQDDRVQRAKNQAEQKAQYASLSDAQKRLDDHAREIGKFADEFRRLAAENAELKAENQRLRNRLGLADEMVRQQHSELDRDRETDEQEL